jgi:hypothetical protein
VIKLIILEKLIKSYFEIKGTHEGFPYEALMKEYCLTNDMPGREAFYTLLGYKMSTLHPSAYPKLRKLYYSGDIAGLKESLQLSSKDQVIDLLLKKGVISKEKMPALSKINIAEEYLPIVRLLASYFNNSEELEIMIGDSVSLFKDYLNRVVYSVDSAKLSSFINSASFKKVLEIVFPRIEYKEDCIPLISAKVLYLPAKLEKKIAVDKIQKMAVMQAMVKILDVPEKIFNFVTRNAISYQLADPSKYLTLLDYSYIMGLSVKDLFTLCGLNYVDNLAYYNNTRCIIYLNGEDSYRIYSDKSIKPEDYVILNSSKLTFLYENSSLKTLSWDELGPYVMLEGKTYINEIF